jgi:hypothetical protein
MAVGLAALAVVIVAVLFHSGERRSGSDLTPNGAFVAALSAGQQACQEGELLPADTSAVRVTLGAYDKPGPAIAVGFTGPHGEPLSSGGLPAGWKQGVVRIPITHVSRASEGVHVCLRDAGPGAIAIAGTDPDPGLHMVVAGKTVEERLRYDYLRPGSETWLQLAPVIAHRTTLAKSGLIRHWAWAGALLLMLLAVGLAARTIVREDTA